MALQAEVNVGSDEFRVVSRVGAKGGASLAFSRAAAKDLVELSKVFAKRGYKLHDPIAYYPLYGWKAPRSTGRGRFVAASPLDAAPSRARSPGGPSRWQG